MARILVVEDSPTVLRPLERLLRQAGHEVCTAHDSLSAFAALTSCEPELIVLDIGLPGVNGLELCAAIRYTPGYEMTPVIILTDSHKHVDIKLSAEFGADAYIMKPFDEEELTNTVSLLLGESTREGKLRMPTGQPTEHTISAA